jgi:hypothetical protein
MKNKDVPKKKGSKSTTVVSYKDILASKTGGDSDEDPVNLEENATSWSESGSPISTEGISEEEERETTVVEEVQPKKKSFVGYYSGGSYEEVWRSGATVFG